MKVLCIPVVLVLLICELSFGQGYADILVDGKTFIQLTTMCDAAGGEKLLIQGDTTLNDNNYKKIFSIECDEEEPILRGFLRADSLNTGLWYLSEGEEKLIMDLQLEEGDFFYTNDYGMVQVESIENTSRKEIIFDTPIGGCLLGPNESKLRFIEGVGPTNGINIYGNFILDCVNLGDSIYFKNEEIYWTDCNVDCLSITTSNYEIKKDEGSLFEVYPMQNGFSIKKENQGILSFFMYDVSGKMVLNGELGKRNEQMSIDWQNNGVFIIVAIDKTSRRVESKKIIVLN
jgi:hypothetical protein